VNSVENITQRNIRAIIQLEKSVDAQKTHAERVADQFVRAIGSWNFLIIQSILMIFWVGLNLVGWAESWDPYPFILLNLVLSVQAAYASPIIMMSQKRQAKVSELRNHLDLQINLLAEQELTKILTLLTQLCEKSGIDLNKDGELLAMEQSTHPSRILKQIETVLCIHEQKHATNSAHSFSERRKSSD
jgi:uncharacterized membrane protein